MNKEIVLIAVIAITLVIASISSPATTYAKKHHHLNNLTDTQKEDSTASDANGNPCNFGPHNDECANVLPAGKDQHIGTCEAVGPNNDAACEIVNDSSNN